MIAFTTGFAVSLSLILAIGAQNAFVLRQGIRGQHVAAVVLTCVVSEAILISVGVSGFDAATEAVPMLEQVAKWGGALFLFAYGTLSMRRAIFVSESLKAGKNVDQTVWGAILTCLGLTWLNPHVYLDTVVLLGAVASQYGSDRWTFGAGALAGSTVFFTTLGYGALRLQPFFARPTSWRILDAGIALLMWTIAIFLIMA